MWDLRVCRGCLVTDTEGKLEPINKMLKMGYQALTGLEMKDGDGYPTYFCLECCVHIKKAWAFRRKSRRAFFVMREIMIIRNEVTIKDIQTINREKTHLNSSSSYWNLKNNIIFNIDKKDDEESSMVEYTPIIDNLVCHNIEVIPEITQNIEEEEIEPAVEDTIDNVEDVDDNDNDNIPEDIDLEDVFKDLKEESSESEIEEVEVEKVENSIEKKANKYPANVYAFDVRIYRACKALCNTNIAVISEIDQKSLQVIRSKMNPFLTAKFKCALCLIVFKDMATLVNHVQDHKLRHGDHVCRVCMNSFATKEQLHIHKAEKHMYEYTCKICLQIMNTLLDVIQHNEKNHPEVLKNENTQMTSLKTHFQFIRQSPQQMYQQRNNMLACFKCNKSFRNRHEFSNHVSNHEGKNLYYCDICLRYNRLKNSLQNHMMKFHLYHYRCKQCSEVFSSRCKARNHIRNGFCRDQCEIKCNFCDLKITSETHAVTHNKFRHYCEVYVHGCNLCGHSYTSLYALYRHQVIVHKFISPMDPKLGDPEHACATCNFQFYSRQAYQKHVVSANHPEVEHFANVCRTCRRIFDNEEQCKTHSCRLKHLEYPRRCDYCDVMLKNGIAREKHHKKHHPQLAYKLSQRIKLCQICGTIVARNRLPNHMKSHSGDLLNKYDCNRCEELTSWPNVYDYVEHVVKTHTHKPYHCAVCNTAFRYRSVCRDHILKMHAPAMLYSCRLCKQQFSHRDFLIEHSKKFHDIIMNKCKPHRLRKNIFVYPHMKIDVSLIESEVLEVTKVDLYDYLHKKYEELNDPTNYLITDTFFQDIETRAPKRRAPNTGVKVAKKRKVTVKDELKTDDNEIVTTRTVVFDKKTAKAKPGANERNNSIKDDVELESHKSEDTGDMVINETVAASEFLVKAKEVNGDNEEESEVSDNKVTNIHVELISKSELKETVSEDVVEESIEQELELIDIDGENYVILNGVLYKVETE